MKKNPYLLNYKIAIEYIVTVPRTKSEKHVAVKVSKVQKPYHKRIFVELSDPVLTDVQCLQMKPVHQVVVVSQLLNLER